MDLEANVVWLHQFLFGDEGYSVSEKVKECDREIQKQTSPYLKK